MIYEIEHYGDKWYSFKNIPQDSRYVKIDSLRCETEQKAINRAKRMLGDAVAIIKVVERKYA